MLSIKSSPLSLLLMRLRLRLLLLTEMPIWGWAAWSCSERYMGPDMLLHSGPVHCTCVDFTNMNLSQSIDRVELILLLLVQGISHNTLTVQYSTVQYQSPPQGSSFLMVLYVGFVLTRLVSLSPPLSLSLYTKFPCHFKSKSPRSTIHTHFELNIFLGPPQSIHASGLMPAPPHIHLPNALSLLVYPYP
jgi:hypothetical protein